MIRRNTILNLMPALFVMAACTGSVNAMAPNTDPMELTRQPGDLWLPDPINDLNTYIITNDPLKPTLPPKQVGHTDQGPVGRPSAPSGGGIAPIMAAPSGSSPSVSSAELADLLGRLEVAVLVESGQPASLGSPATHDAPMTQFVLEESTFDAAPVSIPTATVIPGPGAIVMLGLAGGLAGLRRRR